MVRVVLVLHVRIRGYMYMEVLRILLSCFHCVLYLGNYMEVLRILLSCFHCVLYLGNYWVAMQFSAGTLTTNA
jgi:hypothetical protein